VSVVLSAGARARAHIHTHTHTTYECTQEEKETERTESGERGREADREPLKDLATHIHNAARTRTSAAPKDNPHEYRARIIPVQGRVYGPLPVPYACTRTRALIRGPWMMVRTKGRSRGCRERRRREDYGRAHKV